MVINAADRFHRCRHTELVAQGGFIRCTNPTCSYQVSELPLSKKTGQLASFSAFSSGQTYGERLTKSA